MYTKLQNHSLYTTDICSLPELLTGELISPVIYFLNESEGIFGRVLSFKTVSFATQHSKCMVRIQPTLVLNVFKQFDYK
jgi:hypothetical protein